MFPTLCRHRGGWKHGMAHVCYGHAGVTATAAAGEMLTVWRAPELARGPLSPAILSLSLFLEGGGDKMEKRRKFPALRKETESFNFRLSPLIPLLPVLNRLIIPAAGRCHLCSAQKTVCQNDVDRGQFLRSFMAPDRSGRAHNIESKAVCREAFQNLHKQKREMRGWEPSDDLVIWEVDDF